MGTFKSWLIANIELIYYLGIILILTGAGLFTHMSTGAWVVLIILTGILALISVFSIKSGFGGFIITAFIGTVAIVSAADEGDDVSNGILRLIHSFNPTSIIIIAIIAAVLGILVAIYAYRNFDDTVSLRFLYRNSDVSVFEYAWKYAFNRWFATFMLIMGLAIEILTIISITKADTVL